MSLSIGISPPQNGFATSGVTALNGPGFQNDAPNGANSNALALDKMLAMLIMMMLQNNAQNDGSQDGSGMSGGMPAFGGPNSPNGASGLPTQAAGSQNITQELMQILMQLMMNQMQGGSGSTMSA